eukprot:jgi/Tetstr1/462994/TSEL_007933.t1
MDSTKTLVPHWVRIPKTVKPNMFLKYRLTCVKYDGYRPDDIYYYTNTIPHDSSTTGTLIWIMMVNSAYTVEAFLDLVAQAFSPTPGIAEHSFALDFSECLRPHFQDHIHDINKPHKFEFTRGNAATTAPAEAHHYTMATNTDLNNAVAARVEAEVRAQVLQNVSAFRGVQPGAKERLHDNTSPSDAKGTNLVVIGVSDKKGGKKPFDTGWEKCPTLPWKLVEAVPLSYAKVIHDSSGSLEVFNEDGTMVRLKGLSPAKDAEVKDGVKPTDATLRTEIQIAARSRRQKCPHSKKWAEKKVENILLWNSSWWGKYFAELVLNGDSDHPEPPCLTETEEAAALITIALSCPAGKGDANPTKTTPAMESQRGEADRAEEARGNAIPGSSCKPRRAATADAGTRAADQRSAQLTISPREAPPTPSHVILYSVAVTYLAVNEEFADTLRLAVALTSPVALLRAIRLRTIVIYLTESEFDPSELLIHPSSQTIREHHLWQPQHRLNRPAAQDIVDSVREDQGRASSGTNREAPCRHITSPTTTRPNPTATSSDPSSPNRTPATAPAATARPGAQADDEEELELNYEENDSAMEVDTTQERLAELHHLTTAATKLLAQSSSASQPAIAAKLASLKAESHQLRNSQRLSIQLERHPSQPTPAGKGKAATTAKHKKKQPMGRSRSDGATRNRSRSKPRLSGTRGSDSERETYDDAAHSSSSSHE